MMLLEQVSSPVRSRYPHEVLGANPAGEYMVDSAVDHAVSDAELLRATARGERDSFLELYDRYSPRLMGIISAILRDRHMAEDILQGVMLEIWRQHAKKYDPVLGTVEAWLFRLARSRAIDATRSFHYKRVTTADSIEHEVDAIGSCLDDAASGLTPELASAMRRLPDEVRAPILLAYTRGMTREQIAESLGEPVGTIKTRIRRGLLRLREILEEGEISLGASP